MKQETPQFDTLLDKMLGCIVPHERECAQKDISKYCEVKFKITDEDIKFYKKLRVPPPLCCPTCRRQRRFHFVNRINFYKRENNATGKVGKIVSYVSPASSFIVYDLDYYRSANWDPISFGKVFNSGQDFIEQFYDLRLKVPQYAIVRDPSNINSEYSLNGKNSKNGYFVSGMRNSEDAWHSIFINGSSGIMDSQDVYTSEKCYQVIIGRNLNNCSFCYFSKDCINCSFLYDCKNLQNCFGCVNLHNKKYCFFNQQLSKTDYEEKMKSLKLETRSGLSQAKELFWEFVKTKPVRATRSVNAIDSNGVLIINSKNCHNVNACENGDNERYTDMIMDGRDSMDIYASGDSEMLYETSAVGSKCANVKFSFGSKSVTDCEFLINCHNCQYCFACIGLENKSYCIFNKQYEPEEYFIELDKIKSSLLEAGNYGELFPIKFSPFAYNSSEADLAYPLNKKEVEKLGSFYQPEINVDTQGLEILQKEEVPDSIYEVTDDILNKAIICEESGRPFRIIKSELEFYRKLHLPIPNIHPLIRMKNTFKHLGNNISYEGTCAKCGKNLETIYDVEEGWKLYCDICYQQEVY